MPSKSQQNPKGMGSEPMNAASAMRPLQCFMDKADGPLSFFFPKAFEKLRDLLKLPEMLKRYVKGTLVMCQIAATTLTTSFVEGEVPEFRCQPWINKRLSYWKSA